MNCVEPAYFQKKLTKMNKMEITVINGKEELTVEIKDKMTIKEILEAIKISSETVVVKRNNEVVIEEEIIEDGDIIEIIRVIYGG